jgi:hypothetical protein
MRRRNAAIFSSCGAQLLFGGVLFYALSLAIFADAARPFSNVVGA